MSEMFVVAVRCTLCRFKRKTISYSITPTTYSDYKFYPFIDEKLLRALSLSQSASFSREFCRSIIAIQQLGRFPYTSVDGAFLLAKFFQTAKCSATKCNLKLNAKTYKVPYKTEPYWFEVFHSKWLYCSRLNVPYAHTRAYCLRLPLTLCAS